MTQNLLIIDSASEYLVLTIQNKNGHIRYFHQKVANQQSQYILPEINQLLVSCQLTCAKLDLIAYNQGPGSFTGLRIGASVALSLAYASGCKLLPLPAFYAYLPPLLAYNYQYAIITLDARLGQSYLAGIKLDDFSYTIPPSLINPIKLAELLTTTNLLPTNTIIVDNGLIPYQSQIGDSLVNYRQLTIDYPGGENWLNIIATGKFTTCTWENADLLYIRNKVALNLAEQRQARHD